MVSESQEKWRADQNDIYVYGISIMENITFHACHESRVAFIAP